MKSAYPKTNILIALAFSMSIAWVKCVFANAPVIDSANLIQNIAIKVQAIEQSKTQLKQYQSMLENSKKLDNYTWDKANLTMDDLVRNIDTLNHYKQQAGSMDAYLSRYQNQEHYRNAPCYNGASCTEAERQALSQQGANASEAQKRVNDARMRGVELQQNAMQADARLLITLQKQAEGATGQMAALQAANQLASAQTNQLLQIRGLMVAQQNAAATRALAIADKEAMQAAGDERFRRGTFKKSSGKTW